jgi:hypothetical protein
MYKLEVKQLKDCFRFEVLFGDTVVVTGFRPSESAAHRDGAEELKFAKLFNLGRGSEHARE